MQESSEFRAQYRRGEPLHSYRETAFWRRLDALSSIRLEGSVGKAISLTGCPLAKNIFWSKILLTRTIIGKLTRSSRRQCLISEWLLVPRASLLRGIREDKRFWGKFSCTLIFKSLFARRRTVVPWMSGSISHVSNDSYPMTKGTLSHAEGNVIPCHEDCYPMMSQWKGFVCGGKKRSDQRCLA